MIRQIEIKNFRSHKHTVLDLCNSVNVLMGETDAGKTVIMDAVRWVWENRPTNFKFHSFFAGEDEATEVTLRLAEGHTITRRRSNKENVYVIDGDEDHKLEGFSTNVPMQVQNILNMSRINFGLQIDRPYLMFSGSGDLAKEINACVNLEALGLTMASLTAEKNTLTRDINVVTKSIAEVEGTLKGYEYVEGELQDVETLQRKLGNIERMKDIIEQRKDTLQKYKEARVSLSDLDFIDDLEAKAKSVSMLLSRKADAVKQLNRRRLILTNYKNLKAKAFDDGFIDKAESLIAKADHYKSVESDLERMTKKLRLYLANLARRRQALTLVESNLLIAQTEYTKLSKTVCPTCKRPFKKGEANA